MNPVSKEWAFCQGTRDVIYRLYDLENILNETYNNIASITLNKELPYYDALSGQIVILNKINHNGKQILINYIKK